MYLNTVFKYNVFKYCPALLIVATLSGSFLIWWSLLELQSKFWLKKKKKKKLAILFISLYKILIEA